MHDGTGIGAIVVVRAANLNGSVAERIEVEDVKGVFEPIAWGEVDITEEFRAVHLATCTTMRRAAIEVAFGYVCSGHGGSSHKSLDGSR